jgi:hypothetical protein
MQCKQILEKKNKEGEFVIEANWEELSILHLGSWEIVRGLEKGPTVGTFTNGMDEDNIREMKEVADHVVSELDKLSDSILDNEK